MNHILKARVTPAVVPVNANKFRLDQYKMLVVGSAKDLLLIFLINQD